MNVLVLCADTFRADHLGCYGNDWIETPRLDALAKQSVRFENFYAEGLPTLPARRVLYTGRRIFPFHSQPQKGDMIQLPGWHPLLEEDVTFAEHLGERGYTTGLISDLYHMMKPGKNFQRGFHSWQWIRGQEIDPVVPTPRAEGDLSKYLRDDVPADAPIRRMVSQYLNNRAHWKNEGDHYAAQVMQAAAHWIENYGRKKPWLLWVESFDPHEPWDAPAEFVSKYSPADYDGHDFIWPIGPRVENYGEEALARVKAQYAGECSHVDKWCGFVLDALEAAGLVEETIVVFTSDHGTMLGEQGEMHKGVDRLRTQVTRVPFLLRHPDQAFAGKVVPGFAQHHDLMPTLLHLLGETVPERCNGENFWPLVTGEKSELRDTVISAFGHYASVRTRDWNYQTAWSTPQKGEVRPPELYDCRADPQELHNVIAEHPEIARELQAKLDEVLAGRDTQTTSGDITPAAIPGLKW